MENKDYWKLLNNYMESNPLQCLKSLMGARQEKEYAPKRAKLVKQVKNFINKIEPLSRKLLPLDFIVQKGKKIEKLKLLDLGNVNILQEAIAIRDISGKEIELWECRTGLYYDDDKVWKIWKYVQKYFGDLRFARVTYDIIYSRGNTLEEQDTICYFLDELCDIYSYYYLFKFIKSEYDHPLFEICRMGVMVFPLKDKTLVFGKDYKFLMTF